jgi:hypothetical protein
MIPIVEKVKTKAPPKKVWKAWADTYNWSSKGEKSSSKEKGFKQGRKGFVRDGKGKKASYKIISMHNGKDFTMTWGSILLKMIFHYTVTPQPKGSIVECKVKFGGLFVFPISFFLRKKMRKNVAESLHRFVQQVEMSQPQRKMVRR